MNHPDLRLEEALSDIRREHRQIVPPQAAKEALVRRAQKAIRLQKAAPAFWPQPLLLASAFVLLCVLGVAGFILTRHTAPPREIPIASQKPLQPEMHAVQEIPVSHAVQKHAHARAIRAGNPTSTSKGSSGFIALPSGEGLPAPAVATVVRMRIKPGDLREFGLHVPAVSSQQTVVAEFVVGEDGLSRAVRILR